MPTPTPTPLPSSQCPGLPNLGVPNSCNPPPPPLTGACSGVPPDQPSQPAVDLGMLCRTSPSCPPHSPPGIPGFGPYGGTALDRASALIEVVRARTLSPTGPAGNCQDASGSCFVNTNSGNLFVQLGPPAAGNFAPQPFLAYNSLSCPTFRNVGRLKG